MKAYGVPKSENLIANKPTVAYPPVQQQQQLNGGGSMYGGMNNNGIGASGSTYGGVQSVRTIIISDTYNKLF